MIEILTSGALNSVQDRGRFGFLDVGVSLCGAMDRMALDMGNALLGNPLDAAGIEITILPFRLRFHKPMAFAVTGADCAATLDGEPLPPCWARTARSGQTLLLSPPRAGARAYVTVAGGIAVPLALGSRSTDLKTGFGGLEGRGLKRGDRLETMATLPVPSWPAAGIGALSGETVAAPSADNRDPLEVRVLPAAEYPYFTAQARERFLGSDWQVTREANRMGYRLAGPELALAQKRELFSHGILPGTVQVPPSGQPIIQLADANTCGGYAKIANVIEADLWRLAQAPVGSFLRFIETDRDTAIAALRVQAAWLSDLRATAALIGHT